MIALCESVTISLIRCYTEHYAFPVSNLQQMEATTICVKIYGRLVKLVPAYLTQLRCLITADLSECISGVNSSYLAGDQNAKK